MVKKGSREKNDDILQHREDSLIMIYNHVLSASEQDYLQEELKKSSLAVVLGTSTERLSDASMNGCCETLDLVELLTLAICPVIAIGFTYSALENIGCYNELLTGLNDFEFLCRLTYSMGEVRVLWKHLEEKTELRESDYQTLAYCMRRYLPTLNERGCMEEVFSDMVAEYGKGFQNQFASILSNEEEYDRLRRNTAPFLVFRGDATCAGTLQVFADELVKGLKRRGQAVQVWSADNLEQMNPEDLYKGLVGFQAPVLLNPGLSKVKGKRFQFWFDYPAPFAQYFPNNRQDYFVLCQDGGHAAFIREFFGEERAFHFPPGGVEVPLSGQEERVYDIVFVGSYFPEVSDYDTQLERDFYQYMLRHANETFEEGFAHLLEEKGKKLTKPQFLDGLVGLRKVYRAVLAHFRRGVIDTILEAGFSIHVYGDSWYDYESPFQKQLILHPEIPANLASEEWKKAKIGLNIMSWHKNGMTERVANILLSGALCLTEESNYIRQKFKDGEEIVTFSLEHLEELPGKIKWLLAHTDMREKIAQNGMDKARKEHTWEKRAGELIKMAEEKKVGIFVATHVTFNPPPDPTYIPLQVGTTGKKDLGYVRDNVGENISDLNYLFGELTGLYWIWQNIKEFDYLGICHYRRYFLNEDLKLMTKEDYCRLLGQYDAIIPKHGICEKSYYEHYGDAHDARYLDVIGNVIERIYPDYWDSYVKAMQGNVFYSGNLMVTKKEILQDYSQWLFTIFTEAMDQIDVTGYDAYHMRIYGFLSEQMFYVYLLKNGFTFVEMSVGISGEKAETTELKNKVRKAMEEGNLEGAAQLFQKTLKDRPDVLLMGSDLYGELSNLYKELQEKLG